MIDGSSAWMTFPGSAVTILSVIRGNDAVNLPDEQNDDEGDDHRRRACEW